MAQRVILIPDDQEISVPHVQRMLDNPMVKQHTITNITLKKEHYEKLTDKDIEQLNVNVQPGSTSYLTLEISDE